jgi:hypothetical protein
VAREDSTGKPVPLLMLRADPDEREAVTRLPPQQNDNLDRMAASILEPEVAAGGGFPSPGGVAGRC